MEDSIQQCLQSSLFRNVNEDEILPLLRCLQAKQRVYAKGRQVFSAGATADRLGIVLFGRIETVYEDALGMRSIIDTFGRGQLFCDAFSCSAMHELPVSVVAQCESSVMLIEADRVLHPCEKGCCCHSLLVGNLVRILANKYVNMSRKMLHLSGRSTRRKLFSYLSEQMRQAGGGPFSVPLNRQELADYLFVDRTGLSSEWNKLKREGILLEEGILFRLTTKPCAGLDCCIAAASRKG